jgi:hypothetical protein
MALSTVVPVRVFYENTHLLINIDFIVLARPS